MSNKKKTEIPLWAQLSHSKPTTRRELLATGLISFSASLIAPAYLRFLLPEAHAATTCATSTSTLIPIVTLNLSGGAAMAANFVPVDQGGQFLPSYDLMGLGNGSLPIEREFGNVPFAGMENGNLISKFLQGLRQTSPTALAKTAFVAACVRTRDDSNENMLSIDGLVNAAGLRGSMLPNLGSRSNTVTGINQMPAVAVPSAPLIVSGFGSVQGSLGYAGAVGATLNQAQRVALANSVQKLTDSQMRKLSSMSVNQAIKGLVDCNNKKNQEIVALANAGIDPRTDTTSGGALSTLWNINGGTNNNDRNLVFSTMVYNALKGNAGAASLEIGGYDYHDGTRTRGDAADLVAGQTVGRILETAAIMNRPLFLYVTSDGAVTSPRSDSRSAPWTSDRGTAGASYIMYFDPAGRRSTSNNQIGWFTAGQVADDKTLIGNNPEKSAVAVFANYLKLNNRMAEFQRIVGRSFEASKLDEVIKF